MKYGEYLKSQMHAAWQEAYLDYDALKDLLKGVEDSQLLVPDRDVQTSLSMPPPSNAAGMHVRGATQEAFFSLLEQEMRKIEAFTKQMVPEANSSFFLIFNALYPTIL